MEKSIKSIAYNYGLYYALLSITILVLIYAFNIEKNWVVSSTSLIISVIIFLFGIKALKNSNGGFLKLGEAIKVGLAIAAIGGIIAAVYTYIHYTYIHPEFIENIRELSMEKAYELNPNLTTEQLEKGREMNEMFTSPFALSTFSLIGNLVFGIIVSLIVGLILKKES